MKEQGQANRIFIPNAPLVLTHPSELLPGDRVFIGRRAWIYAGRVSQWYPAKNAQDEYVFHSPEGEDGPGEIGQVERTYSQSELEAFALAGFVQRQTWATVHFDPNHKVIR